MNVNQSQFSIKSYERRARVKQWPTVSSWTQCFYMMSIRNAHEHDTNSFIYMNTSRFISRLFQLVECSGWNLDGWSFSCRCFDSVSLITLYVGEHDWVPWDFYQWWKIKQTLDFHNLTVDQHQHNHDDGRGGVFEKWDVIFFPFQLNFTQPKCNVLHDWNHLSLWFSQ